MAESDVQEDPYDRLLQDCNHLQRELGKLEAKLQKVEELVNSLKLYTKAYAILDNYLIENLNHLKEINVEKITSKTKIHLASQKIISDNKHFSQSFSSLIGLDNPTDDSKLTDVLAEVIHCMYSYLKESLISYDFEKSLFFNNNEKMKFVNDILLKIPLTVENE